MYIHRTIPKILLVGSLLLALVVGFLAARIAWASPTPDSNPDQDGVTIPYPGRLSISTGEPAANGSYDFSLNLYTAETGGEQLWTEIQEEITVTAGVFNLTLGSIHPIPASALDRSERWLEVAVRGPGEDAFTRLQPRQFLSSTQVNNSEATTSTGCPHNHFAETWSGNSGYGLMVETTNSNLSGALYGRTYSAGSGVYGEAIGSSSINVGILGTSNSPSGYGGKFTNTSSGKALYAENNSGGIALYAKVNSGSDALYAENSGGGIAIHAKGNGAGNTKAALRVENDNGLAAYLTNTSGNPTLEIDKTNPGGAAIDLQLFNPGNLYPAHFITAYNENTVLQFMVASSGVVAANGYIDWLADMAEMLPAVEGLEPGEVLIIGKDGNLTRSTEPYQTSVAGVYSTNPGFMFGHPLEGEIPGTIPLAVAGVVPVKVSAENGPIQPGDLLVSSSTAGYAMKASANPPQGSVIGKALAALEKGLGVIKVLAMLQ